MRESNERVVRESGERKLWAEVKRESSEMYWEKVVRESIEWENIKRVMRESREKVLRQLREKAERESSERVVTESRETSSEKVSGDRK